MLKRGETWRETLVVSSSGTPDKPVVFSAYGSGNNPKIVGSDAPTFWTNIVGNVWNATVATEPQVVWFNGAVGQNKTAKTELANSMDWYWTGNTLSVYSVGSPTNIEASQRNTNVYVQSRDYVTIDNLDLLHANDSNIYLKDAKYCIVQNSAMHDVHNHGILMFLNSSGGHTIQNNNIYNTGINRHIGGEGSAVQSMNTISIPITLQNNYIYNVYGDSHDHGYYCVSAAADIIRYNKFKDIAGDGVKLDTNPLNAQVYYNIFENCASNGIAILTGASATVYNNTIYNCGVYPGTSPYGGIWYRGASGAIAVVKNNIIYGAGAGLLVDNTTGFSSDNNLIYGGVNIGQWESTTYNTLSSWRSVSGQDAHSIASNPDFKEPSQGNFALKSSSLCVDAGTDVGLKQDHKNVPVPQGSGVDIGAFEYKKETVQPPATFRALPPVTN